MSGRGGRFEDVPIARVAEFWDGCPCNIRHSPRPVGTKQYFDEVEARKYLVEPHIPAFAEFPRWRGKRVLEVGCGIGTDTINFARHGARVTAVDLSATSIDIARRRAEIFGLADRITFYCADAEELSRLVPVEPYDLAYAFGVVHHTPRPERAIDEMRRYVRPGGTIKIMVYHRCSWKAIGIALSTGRVRLGPADDAVARQSEAQEGCPVTYTYRPRDVVRLLRGFRIRNMWVDHIFPYRVGDYVGYRYTKVWYVRALPRPAFRWLERHLGWHLCVTAEAAQRR